MSVPFFMYQGHWPGVNVRSIDLCLSICGSVRWRLLVDEEPSGSIITSENSRRKEHVSI